MSRPKLNPKQNLKPNSKPQAISIHARARRSTPVGRTCSRYQMPSAVERSQKFSFVFCDDAGLSGVCTIFSPPHSRAPHLRSLRALSDVETRGLTRAGKRRDMQQGAPTLLRARARAWRHRGRQRRRLSDSYKRAAAQRLESEHGDLGARPIGLVAVRGCRRAPGMLGVKAVQQVLANIMPAATLRYIARTPEAAHCTQTCRNKVHGENRVLFKVRGHGTRTFHVLPRGVGCNYFSLVPPFEGNIYLRRRPCT